LKTVQYFLIAEFENGSIFLNFRSFILQRTRTASTTRSYRAWARAAPPTRPPPTRTRSRPAHKNKSNQIWKFHFFLSPSHLGSRSNSLHTKTNWNETVLQIKQKNLNVKSEKTNFHLDKIQLKHLEKNLVYKISIFVESFLLI
jgi:hypothetical protein